jgi:putative SOS response-associated peptidase YedK
LLRAWICATAARNYPPRWNAAPSQDLPVIPRNHETGIVSLDPLRRGLIPHWCQDRTGERKPINAKCETVHRLPMFKDAYRRRRCILPVDGFFESKAMKGQRAKQPYAIAMKDGKPFGIGGLWENWPPRQVSGLGRSLLSLPTLTNW